MSKRLYALRVSALALWLTCNLQGQTATGSISRTVTDATGAVVPSAAVTVTNKATATARNLTTNTDGLFSAPALVAGDYEVRVEMQGFRTEVRNAQVRPAAACELSPPCDRRAIDAGDPSLSGRYQSTMD